jgi:hypothetical protein
MSNDLVAIPNKLPAFMQSGAPDTSEFTAGIQTGLPIPSFSIRGKELRIRKDGQEMNTRLRELEVIVVAARPGKRLSKRYYARKYESGSNEAPDCSSADGLVPNVPNPVHHNCSECPMNAWGSKISESGKEAKACQDYKRVVVYPVGLKIDEPVLLDLSATNVRFSKEQRAHTGEMDYATYMQMLTKHGIKPFQAVSRIEFTDAEYPQLCFKFSRLVDEDEYARVMEMREMDEVREVLEADLHVTAADGVAADDAPAVAEKPKPAAKKPAAKKPEPEPEPEPEPAPAAKPGFTPRTMRDPDSGDTMVVKSKAAYIEALNMGFELSNDAPAAEQSDAEKAAEHHKKQAAAQREEAAKPEAAPAEGDLLSQLQSLLGGK